MRQTDHTQHAMFSYRSLEERIPPAHPLRKLRVLVDGILQSMSAEFEALYSRRGRPSIAPERLLRASLIQTLFSIRSERQLVQHIEYNLLYRCFVGMNIDKPVWNHSTFSANRERLFSDNMAQRFFQQVQRLPRTIGWQAQRINPRFLSLTVPSIASHPPRMSEAGSRIRADEDTATSRCQ